MAEKLQRAEVGKGLNKLGGKGAEVQRCTWKDRGANFCRVIKEALFVQGARPSTTYSNTSSANRYH